MARTPVQSAQQHAQAGRYAEAEEAARQAVKIKPDDQQA